MLTTRRLLLTVGRTTPMGHLRFHFYMRPGTATEHFLRASRWLRMQGMNPPFEGGCLCGAVRYVLTATPHYVYFCHCRDCQRESGSPFVTDMNIDRAALRITVPLTRYTRTGDSGQWVHRNFCTVCGTTLLTEFDV